MKKKLFYLLFARGVHRAVILQTMLVADNDNVATIRKSWP